MRAERRLGLAAGMALAMLALCGSGLPAHAATGFGLAELTTLLAQVRSGTASFVERREVAMLDRTQESSGRLTFEAPDTFVRETLKPREEKLAVVGNTVTMIRAGRSRTMQLDAAPEAAVIVEAVRGTLTGNREALERLFETRVSGSAELWTLELVPRASLLREQVSSVTVRGERAKVKQVSVRLADGDRSVMAIEPEAAASAPARGASRPPSAPP